MRKRLVIVVAGLGLGALVWSVNSRHHASSPEQEHIAALARLRYAPAIRGVAGYFSSDYLMWNLQGRHSDPQVNQIKSQHKEDLVASGYLQRHSFTLEHRKLANDGTELQELQQLHRRACEAAGLGAPLVFWSTDSSNLVTVTARPREIKVFEEVLRGFDSTNTSPNPQDGTTVSKPLHSRPSP